MILNKFQVDKFAKIDFKNITKSFLYVYMIVYFKRFYYEVYNIKQ